MSPAASTRWCPTPEQVMILEEMYRGGVRTPNAAHIQQITSHLSIYGKIEGKNVFYWFQNHKARDRQKLRKRLVGKQHQHQHQHMMIMSQIPPNNVVVDHHHFHQHPSPPAFLPLHHRQPPQQLHHFDQLPCFPASSTLLGFHHHHHHHPPPLFLNSPCFAPPPPPPLQARCEDRYGQVANNKEALVFGLEKEKPGGAVVTRSTNKNDYDWMMMATMREDDDNDDDDDYGDDDGNGDDDDDDDDDYSNSSRRSLKTLQLFPIKDKTLS